MYYYDAVVWGRKIKIVEGYNGGFRPDDPIAREELAAMLYRYEQYTGGGFKDMCMFLLDYPDAEQVSQWAYESMCWMTMNGIIEGTDNGFIAPSDHANRAETATMIERYITD